MVIAENFKDIIRQTYDDVAANYDHPANFFSKAMNKPMLRYLQLAADSKLLDVGTGTGVFALYVAKQMPDCEVTGIDLSTAMLEQASDKTQGLTNIHFHSMDMEVLTFTESSFDAITCCFSLYFLENIEKGLSHLATRLKPGGRMAVSFYQTSAFQPLADLFKQRYALFKPEYAKSEPWESFSNPASTHALFTQAGLDNIKLFPETLRFHLTSADMWWDILWNTGYRRLLKKLSDKEFAIFKQQHMQEVTRLCKDTTYWVDCSMMIAIGDKPTY